MKNILVLFITVFLCFSINGVSLSAASVTANSISTEQHKRGKAATRHKPRKLEPKKRVHKSGPKQHTKKKETPVIRL